MNIIEKNKPEVIKWIIIQDVTQIMTDVMRSAEEDGAEAYII